MTCQIVVASEEVPLLSLLFKLDMVLIREILNHAEFQIRNGLSEVGVSPLERRRRIC